MLLRLPRVLKPWWQGDPARSASHGFFINLNAVLLRLCDPFLEPMSGKAWGKLDARHVPVP